MPNPNCDGQDLSELGLSNLLKLPSVKDLELTDDQNEKLAKAKRDFERKRQSQINALVESKRADPDSDIRKELSSIDKKLLAEFNQDIWEILLSHQQKKLVPLYLWSQAKNYVGFRRFLVNKLVQEKIELTPKQIASIKPAAEKLQKEFEEDLEKLKQKYRKRLTDKVLSKEQQGTFDRVIGRNIGTKEDAFQLRF